jgi:hypothetical protein
MTKQELIDKIAAYIAQEETDLADFKEDYPKDIQNIKEYSAQLFGMKRLAHHLVGHKDVNKKARLQKPIMDKIVKNR